MGKITYNGKDLTKPFSYNGKKVVKLELNSKVLSLLGYIKWDRTLGTVNVTSNFKGIPQLGVIHGTRGTQSFENTLMFGDAHSSITYNKVAGTIKGAYISIPKEYKKVKFTFKYILNFQQDDNLKLTWEDAKNKYRNGTLDYILEFDDSNKVWKLVSGVNGWLPVTLNHIFLRFSSFNGETFILSFSGQHSVGNESACWISGISSMGDIKQIYDYGDVVTPQQMSSSRLGQFPPNGGASDNGKVVYFTTNLFTETGVGGYRVYNNKFQYQISNIWVNVTHSITIAELQ